MGIIAGPVEASGLQVLHFSTDHLVLMVPVGHPLSGQASVTWNRPWPTSTSACMKAAPS